MLSPDVVMYVLHFNLAMYPCVLQGFPFSRGCYQGLLKPGLLVPRGYCAGATVTRDS
jgi:hypothetical protein